MFAVALSIGALMVPGEPKREAELSLIFERRSRRLERRAVAFRRIRHLRRLRRSRGARAARWALSQVGVPYVWGAEAPGVGFDCSGLVQWAYSRVGVRLPRTTWGMAGAGREVPVLAIRPGDIVESYGFEHVVLYVGHGMVVQAPHSGTLVGTAPLSWFPIDEVRRVA